MVKSIFLNKDISVSQPVKIKLLNESKKNILVDVTNKISQTQIIEIDTPKRKATLLSPTALEQIGGSPYSKKYLAMRKIDFTNNKLYTSKKKISFKK